VTNQIWHGGQSSAEGDRAKDRAGDKLHHSSVGSLKENPPRILVPSLMGPKLSLKGTPRSMGCGCRSPMKLFKAIKAY